MFCKNCGVKVADDARFCYSCGTALSEPAIASNQGVQASPYTSFPQPQNTSIPPIQNPYTSPNTYTIPTYVPSEPKKESDVSKNGFAICSLVLGIFGAIPCFINVIPAALALIFSIIGKKSEKRGAAIAGMILAIIGLVLGTLMIMALIYDESSVFGGESYSDFSDYGMYF